MKNNTLKRTTTKSTKSFVDNFPRLSRSKKWDIPLYVHRNPNKDRTRKNIDYLSKVPDFLEQRHSGIPIDLTYIFPTVKSMLGNLKEEELQYLDYRVLYKAEELIKKLRSITQKNKLWWHQPLLNISIDDEIVFEWWHKEKKLTIYVCPNTIDFIKVWGADMDDEMEDGSIYLSNHDAILGLWQWIALSKND
ncbi:MAG: hypothetical protein ACRC6M_07170 [Microcystaceae cyanobacterium]